MQRNPRWLVFHVQHSHEVAVPWVSGKLLSVPCCQLLDSCLTPLCQISSNHAVQMGQELEAELQRRQAAEAAAARQAQEAQDRCTF